MSVFPSNSKSIFIFLCFIVLFHIPNVTADEDTLLVEVCATSKPFGIPSEVTTNVNHLLDSLIVNGSRDGYFNNSVGDWPYTMYGLAQCRGDLPMEHCRTCLTTAATRSLHDCADGTASGLQYDRCMLRYSSINFFSVEDTYIYWNYTADIVDEYLESFSAQLQGLMKKLSNDAVLTPTRYSSGKSDNEYAPSQFLYGAVQCTRDISPSDCDDCLQRLYLEIRSCCYVRERATLFTGTCYIKYQNEKFVEDPPSSNQILPPPPPVSNPEMSNGNDVGKSFNVLYIIVAVIASIMLE